MDDVPTGKVGEVRRDARGHLLEPRSGLGQGRSRRRKALNHEAGKSRRTGVRELIREFVFASERRQRRPKKSREAGRRRVDRRKYGRSREAVLGQNG